MDEQFSWWVVPTAAVLAGTAATLICQEMRPQSREHQRWRRRSFPLLPVTTQGWQFRLSSLMVLATAVAVATTVWKNFELSGLPFIAVVCQLAGGMVGCIENRFVRASGVGPLRGRMLGGACGGMLGGTVFGCGSLLLHALWPATGGLHPHALIYFCLSLFWGGVLGASLATIPWFDRLSAAVHTDANTATPESSPESTSLQRETPAIPRRRYWAYAVAIICSLLMHISVVFTPRGTFAIWFPVRPAGSEAPAIVLLATRTDTEQEPETNTLRLQGDSELSEFEKWILAHRNDAVSPADEESVTDPNSPGFSDLDLTFTQGSFGGPPIAESAADASKESATPGQVVLLDFSATWCGPCKQMEPVIAQMKANGYSVQKVDIDEHKQLAKVYRITSVPTFVLLNGEEEVGRLEGTQSYDTLAQMFSGYGRGGDNIASGRQSNTSSLDADSGSEREANLPSRLYLQDDVQFFPQDAEPASTQQQEPNADVESKPTPGLQRIVVTNTNDSGPGSLREAIELANDRPGHDEIRFELPAGEKVIKLVSELPTISDSLTVDGRSTDEGQSPQGIKIACRNLETVTYPERKYVLWVEAENCIFRSLTLPSFCDVEAGPKCENCNVVGNSAWMVRGTERPPIGSQQSTN